RCHCRSDFANWYKDYAQAIRNFVLSRTHDPLLADDCTSETFLKAFAHRNSFQCQGQGVRPWLVTIARNVVRDYLRTSQRQKVTVAEAFTESTDPAPNPEQLVLERATIAEISRCVGQLSSDQAQCIRLRFTEGLSVNQTARMMERSEGAVRALQYRAIRELDSILLDSHR
ncbi:MAG: sigma-70 family RNA polymerase sigma factor, partial [Actinophytocola sp.]|nr:sigma-70 family RNA polymerase sigma factor [Actinophytocola sp.]